MTAAIVRADARHLPLPDASVDLIVTSPPYYALRSYQDTCNVCRAIQDDGHDPRVVIKGYEEHVRRHHHYAGQIGAEATPREYVAALLECTREWMRVLKPTGSLFVNLGDKYSGAQGQSDGAPRGDSADFWRRTDPTRTNIPNKSLMGLPWRYALGCIDDLGLILRAEVIWSKPNGLPESVTDRVRRSHEQFFHFTLQPRYYSAVDEIRQAYEAPNAIRTNGRSIHSGIRKGGDYAALSRDAADSMNPLGKLPGSVWEVATQPLKVPAHLAVEHFAAFPPALIRRIILGWSPPGICTACGEGRRPVVHRDRLNTRPLLASPAHLAAHEGDDRRSFSRGETTASITGYACACPTPDAPTRPSLVVDPFGGTGTTALVASVHGRHGVSVDLSADYCRLAAWRTTDPGERARALGVAKPPPVTSGQIDMFGESA